MEGIKLTTYQEQTINELEKEDTQERISIEVESINKLTRLILSSTKKDEVFTLSNNLIRTITGLTNNKLYLLDLEKESDD